MRPDLVMTGNGGLGGGIICSELLSTHGEELGGSMAVGSGTSACCASVGQHLADGAFMPITSAIRLKTYDLSDINLFLADAL